MEQYRTSKSVVTMPNQKVSYHVKKTKAWQRGSMDWVIGASSRIDGKRKSVEEMKALQDFNAAQLTKQEIKKHIDPLNVDLDSDVTEDEIHRFNFFDIVQQPLDTLYGEHLKRSFDVRAYAVNPDVVNEKDKMFQEKAYSYFSELAQQEQLDEDKLKAKIEELELMLKNDVQTAHELMANSILKVIQTDTNAKTKYTFNKGFKNFEVLGEVIFKVDNVGPDPKFRHVTSENFTVLGIDDSNFIEDGYAWKETRYMHPFEVVKEFGTLLTDREIDKVLSSGEGNMYNPTQQFNQLNKVYSNAEDIPYILVPAQSTNNGVVVSDGRTILNAINQGGSGLVKVERVEWITLKQIGILKYIDETGAMNKMWVPEQYEVQEELGESVEWIWVQEMWKGTLILDDIYTDIGPLPVQMRRMSNPFIVRPSYFGYINSEYGRKAQSRFDKLIPYQRMFNVTMEKLITLWTQNLGKVPVVDLARIPKGMSTDEWYVWLKRMGLMIENSFEQGREGVAKGQLAGHMQLGNRVIDLSLAQEIDQAIKMLSWIEMMVNKIAAVPEPRQGQLSGNEGLGVSQQAIIQSSHQTEFDFYILDMLEATGYELILEYAKVLWKDEKFKRQYLLDDLSNYILEVDGAVLTEAEYGIKITNSSKMFELVNTMRQLYHAAMQTNAATLSDIASMMMAESPSEMLVKLKQTEEKRIKQQQQSQEMQNQANKESMEMQRQMMLEQHQMDLEKMREEYALKMQEKSLDLQFQSLLHNADQNNNGIEDKVELDMAKLDQEAKMAKIKSDEKIAREKMANDLKIASKRAIPKPTKK